MPNEREPSSHESRLSPAQAEQIRRQKEIYDAQTKPEQIEFRVGERVLYLGVDPRVANPNIMNSAYQMAIALQSEELGDYFKGRVVTDMGTGSGIQGLVAAELGAKHVYMADIQPEATRCAAKNIVANELSETCEAFTSDLFAAYHPDWPPSEVHLFNHPFFADEPDEDRPYTRMMLGGVDLIGDYFEQVKAHSTPDAIYILPWFTLADSEDGIDNDPGKRAPEHSFEVVKIIEQAPVQQGVQRGQFKIYVLRQAARG